ncbi:helix-turn-helix domain-containing protein [Cohnella sp.]|uniref:helix-turn-helix domain-containing protein n=1 Tax=Cohnella sp. TaxID=1883426 RepID=UPI00356630B0
MNDLGIFDELSEYIAIRMNSYREETHDGNWIEHKTHYDYDLWLIQSGTVRIQINGFEHTAAPGDVVFFYPQVPYAASTDEEGCRFIYVHFDYGIGGQQRILSDFPLSGIIPSVLIREEVELFSRSCRRMRERDNLAGNRLYLKACLTAVIAKIIELHGQDLYTGEFLQDKRPRKTEKNVAVLQPVFRYVFEHLHRPIKMNELASIADISEKYFISYFKKALGITPGQYIYQIRMNRARDYLYQKKYTIQQIAGLLGYPDPFTFSKAFKKYYKVPPSKFE